MSELLVLVEGRRLLLLLLLSLLLLGRRGLLLSISHARVVEVVEGGVDVAHMASSVHRLRQLTSLWRTLRPGWAEHHLGLDVGQGLHPGHRGGGGEGRPGLCRELLLLLLVLRGELSLGRRHLGERHDGRVLVLDRPADSSAVGKSLGELRLLLHSWVRQVEIPVAGSEGRRRHQRKLLLLLGVLWVAGHHLRLLLVVESLLGLLGLMVGGSRGSGLTGLHGQRSRRHAELSHPVDHTAMVTSTVSSTASILSGLKAALQPLLQLPAKLLSIRPEVEEVVALLLRQSLLLGQSCQFLVSIFPPLIPQAASSEGLVIKSVQGILGLKCSEGLWLC